MQYVKIGTINHVKDEKLSNSIAKILVEDVARDPIEAYVI
jgi:hypothetical protein